MAIDLDATLNLPLASRYAFPDDGKAVIPTSYGDFFDPLAIPADGDDGGFLPAVMIDRLNWIFAINSRPIPSSPAPLIYAGDTLQLPSVYTWSASVDIEGIGQPIAAIQFNVNPGTRQISWRGHGTASAGALIQNPLYAIYDILSAYAGWTLDDFDWASAFETFRTLGELSAGLNWCFWKPDITIRQWLTEMLRGYHVDHFETSEGKLAMVLDRGILGLSVTVPFTIDAQIDLEGTEDDVEYEIDSVNIVNELTVKRRRKWTTDEYTDEPTVDHRPSVGVYGPLRGEVELPAVYTDAHGIVWVRAFFGRYSYLPGMVRFTTRGLGYLTALPGTYIGFTWPWLDWTQARLLKVLNQEVDPFALSISFECFDCGRSVADEVTLGPVALTEVRRRIRVPDTSVDLAPPGPASFFSAGGSYRQIVLRWTAPRDLDYSYTEIWAATTNNRALATHVRNSSRGAPGSDHEETFQVADNAVFYVWLMTVDNSANGRNGGSEATGGNWYPNSVSGGPGGWNTFPSQGGGVRAASVLVDTIGITPKAVTFYHSRTTLAPLIPYIGEAAVADAYLDDRSFPQGDVIARGLVFITMPSLGTAIVQIKQGSISGVVTGVSYFVNAVTNPAFPTVSPRIDVMGMDFAPPWNGFYQLTVRVLGQNGGDVSWTLNNADLSLRHTQR
jgi:hypothetical protein